MRGWPLFFFCMAAFLFAACILPPIQVGIAQVAEMGAIVQNADAVEVVTDTAKAPSVYWWIALVGAIVNTVVGFITANPPKDGKGGK